VNIKDFQFLDQASAVEIIHEAQDLIAAYIIPDSGISDFAVVNQLLELFDGPETRRFSRTVTAEERKANELACEADRQYSEGKR
jgi:hypothetical protein